MNVPAKFEVRIALLAPEIIGYSTRKLSYRKDNRAMRPIYGCPENFRESLSTLLLPKFLMGFCSDRSYECAYPFPR